mgnify:CR=1 FL=1
MDLAAAQARILEDIRKYGCHVIQVLAEGDLPFGDTPGVGTGRNWAHVNAIDYDADDDSIIVSARRQGVWKLTVTSSETNFGFAPSPAAASSTL